MSKSLSERLAAAPVVPLIGEDDAGRAVKTAEALAAGGLSVIEVVMRSPDAQKGMEAILAEATGDLIVGAGTVLTLDQAKSVRASGAQFIVSPELVDEIAEYCLAENIPFYPGTMTAGEVQRAYALGLREVKFFPASLAGGVPMLKAFSSVFREMRFMPTGGVSAANLAEFVALPSVLACGGSWLTPKEAVAIGDYSKITTLASEAVAIAAQAR
ncbi:bifunctional 4-hydroxy-2-oxoglutarate aldolase/2-dehydro-3-deoxy-phosphogluconate aldolase [Qipengyuania sp. S6317L1]|uniref:bifunctional 4-hydroxy-2-oxoglutarate aldolase/2-dehydro-3-deoxy-phosphogluconate aldolase n=1 Tax=Qipengyuania sp. S6317L1 TaxID=2926410 RepID=UPI001FF40E1C|nr:bifunctional 4-hydroxy-2-oxoglutarate aldolase/2-dehydro-3-deoxy-phosphogluconate aldolase [Qipengyuania sp. S6317L1]MCK0098315.1 bifunctional 4-hydroxy-2-oxoglutarate aldolase/2-dehydro-3-deoxy-phosphogluconate aldolase [Qipengyuania sp. S6317L1]